MSSSGIMKLGNAKQLRNTVSDSQMTKISPKYPYISSFKLFRCPTKDCNKTLSPSTTLAHFIADHRNLIPHSLHPGGKVTMEVATELKEFTNTEPIAIRFAQVHVGHNVIPLLINVCCLSEKEYQSSCVHWKFDHSGSWICLWLSSICNFDNWFSISLNNKDSPKTSMTKICKPLLSQHPMTSQEILADFNVMIVEHETVKTICGRDSRLKLDVTMYEK